MNVFIRIKKLSYQSKYWLGCRYFEETIRDKMLVNVFQDLADMTMLCLRFCQFIHFFLSAVSHFILPFRFAAFF